MLLKTNIKPKVINKFINLTLSKNNKNIIITGPSGCGKSSFFMSLLGFMEFEGEVEYLGSKYTYESINKIRLNFSFVPSKFQPYSNIKTKNWFFKLNEYKYSTTKINIEILENYFKMLNLDLILLNKPLNSLSQGQIQRVLIINAKLMNRKILLADEPLTRLDDNNKDLALAFLLNNFEYKIIITHQMSLFKDFEVVKL